MHNNEATKVTVPVRAGEKVKLPGQQQVPAHRTSEETSCTIIEIEQSRDY